MGRELQGITAFGARSMIVALPAGLMLRLHYKLSLRSLEGFVNSLLTLLGLPLSCSD